MTAIYRSFQSAKCRLCGERVEAGGVYGVGPQRWYRLYCGAECRDAHVVEEGLSKDSRR